MGMLLVYLIVVLICISLMNNDAVHVFIVCHLCFHYKVFKLFPTYWFIVFLLMTCKYPLYILKINPEKYVHFINIFHSFWLTF
jgi:hypothetical protein